jgi:uncharacterized protein
MEQSPNPIPAPLTDVTPPRRSKPGPKPGTEAAKRGGQAAKQKYGSTFYAVIGAKGGTTVRDRKGVAFYETIGRQGGETTRRRYGLEHYARIGRIGGAHHRHHTEQAAGLPLPDHPASP